MPTRSSAAHVATARVYLRRPRKSDQSSFIQAARRSQSLHRGWVSAPGNAAAYRRFLKRYAKRSANTAHVAYLAFRNEDNALVGVFNFSEIVRSAFKCAYLGYYAFAPHAGSGLMTEGLALALDVAFRKLKLHRVEVNIQPTNRRSLALVRRVGFSHEGFSRRYVKIAGRWRDHVRFAILSEDWRERRGAVFARFRRPR